MLLLRQSALHRISHHRSVCSKSSSYFTIRTFSTNTHHPPLHHGFYSTWGKDDYLLSEADSAALWEIAMLTPYEGGFGVYTARIMLGLDPEEYLVAYRKPKATLHAVKQTVRVFPNPTSGSVTIAISAELPMSNTLVEIFSISGKLMHRFTMTSNSETISLNGLPKGIYFIRAMNGNLIFGTEKLIVE